VAVQATLETQVTPEMLAMLEQPVPVGAAGVRVMVLLGDRVVLERRVFLPAQLLFQQGMAGL
jgi:hypothetical protein